MNHVKALLIKFVMCLVVVWLILGVFYNINFGHVLTLSVILTVASYMIGDLYLLERIENWGATISDFLLAFAVIWLYSVNLIEVNFPVLTAAGLTSLILAFGEWFYHKYVDRQILDPRRYKGIDMDERLQTEFSDELDSRHHKDDNPS